MAPSYRDCYNGTATFAGLEIAGLENDPTTLQGWTRWKMMDKVGGWRLQDWITTDWNLAD